MSVSLGIDLTETSSNQDISTESSEDYTLDPIREILGTVSCCSAVGFPRFLAHKTKSSLSFVLESSGVIYLIDIRTLLYVITLIRALTSMRISICSGNTSFYINNGLTYKSIGKFKKITNKHSI